MNRTPPEGTPVIVVDDDFVLRQLIADILMDEGFDVLQAADANEALKLLEERHDIRLLVTDIQMPGEPDGLGLLDLVHQRWPDVLLMVTSGQITPRVEDLPNDAQFIRKPFNQREMLRQVNDLFSRHEQ